MLRHLSQSDRPQFLFVVVGETILGPTLTAHGPVGTGLGGESSARPLQRRKRAPRLGRGPNAHAAMEKRSVSDTGGVSPCSISSAITRRSRALAFSVASSELAPYTGAPGSSGISAIHPPSVSRRNRILSCIW